MEKLLLKPAEVAQTLSMGRSKVYQLISDGQLPVVRIGGCLRIPAERLREWVAAQAS